MTPAARAHAYLRQKPGAMSPKQQRRYRKKVFRGLLNSVAVSSDFAPSDSSSPVPDGVSPTPARDPKSGSGAVDEMDPSPAYTGSVPVAPRLDIPRAAGEHTN